MSIIKTILKKAANLLVTKYKHQMGKIDPETGKVIW